MKKSLLLTFLAGSLSWISADAQISLTDVDFAVVGDTLVYANDTMSIGVQVGPAGAAQTWDFTGLQIHYYDTSFMRDPATTIAGADFPASNIAIEDPSQTIYAITSVNGIEIDGFYGDPLSLGEDFDLDYIPNLSLINFPTNYLDSDMDTSGFDKTIEASSFTNDAVDSLRFKRNNYRTNVIDAHGDLSTVAGTYTTIRQFTTSIEIDSMWIYVSDPLTAMFLGVPANEWTFAPPVPGFLDENPLVDTTYKYSWFANLEDGAIVEMDTDAPEGLITNSRFQLGDNVMALIDASTAASCEGVCNGTATAGTIAGEAPFTYAWSNGESAMTATALCDGAHTVTITDNTGSEATADVVITNGIGPAVGVNTEDASCPTCGDGEVYASAAGGTPPYTYLWSDGMTTSGSTAVDAGTYSVTVTDANGCESIASGAVSKVIDFNASQSTMDAYPNPSSGIVNISIEGLQNGALKVFNAAGALVKTGAISIDKSTFDLSTLNDGIYIIQVKTPDAILTRRIELLK